MSDSWVVQNLNNALNTWDEKLAEVGTYQFGGCNSLKTITIPSSVTNIGEEAFVGCKSLTSVTILGNMPRTSRVSIFSPCDNLTIHAPANSTAVSGKPHVPVAANHARIKLVRKVSALF